MQSQKTFLSLSCGALLFLLSAAACVQSDSGGFRLFSSTPSIYLDQSLPKEAARILAELSLQTKQAFHLSDTPDHADITLTFGGKANGTEIGEWYMRFARRSIRSVIPSHHQT